jgi:hypothetical protein
MTSIEVPIYFEDCDVEIIVWANVTDYYPGDPGKYFGKPEDCYPAEDPEVAYYLSWKRNGPYSVFLNEWIMEEFFAKGKDDEYIIEEIMEYLEAENDTY